MENKGADQNGVSQSADKHNGELSTPASKVEAGKTEGAFDYQNKSLEDRLSGLLNEIGILKEENQSVLLQKEELESRLAVLKGEYESVNEEKDKLLSQNDEIKSQLTEEIDRLLRLLSEKEDDTLGNLITEKETLVTELMDIKRESERLKNENTSLKDQLVEARKQVSEMGEENANLQGQLFGMKEENVTLQGQLSDVNAKVLVLEDRHSKVASDILAENSHLKSENAILQKNMETIGAESQKQLNALEKKHSRLQEEKEKQRIEIDSLHTMKSCIEQEKASLGKKLEEASRDLEVVSADQQHINDLENQLKIVSSEKKDLEDARLNLETEVKRLALSVEEQDKLKARIREFEVNFEAVKIALESKDNTIQQLTLELKSLQHSPEANQQRSLLWPAVLASGSLGVVAAFGYLKFSKHH